MFSEARRQWSHSANRTAGCTREYSEAQSGKLTEPSAAELAAIAMERWMAPSDRMKAQPFQAEKEDG